jgi:YidC/Oxa1 family membrane protein insertase
VNKNTIFAFILILGSVTFFSSPMYQKFWVEKIQGKKYEPISQNTSSLKKEEKKEIETDKKAEEVAEKKEEIKEQAIISEKEEEKEIKIDTVWIENQKMKIGISEKGARIVSIKMKDYRYNEEDGFRKKGELIDLIPSESKGAAQLEISGKSYDENVFNLKGQNKEIKIKENENSEIEFEYSNENETIIKKYIIGYDTYKIGLKVKERSLSGKRVKVSWESGIEESEKGRNANNSEKRCVHYYNGENVNHISLKKEGKGGTTGQCKWIGITSKYFLVAIVSDSIADADINYKGFEAFGKDNKIKEINYSVNYEKTAEENEIGFWFYTGPSKYENLKNEKIKFEKVLFPVTGWTKSIFADSWFPPIAEFVLWILLSLTRMVKDYGIAILLLTLLSKIVTFPMMHSSTKKMNKMRELQPKMNLIREKYKNNPKKMNEELMEMYRKEGVNPLDIGCLPMLLQMPIFIALFVVLKKAIELRGAGTFLLPWVHDLSMPESLFSITGIFKNGLPLYGTSVALMPIIMAVIQYYQNKMTIKDPNQKAMVYFMPIFMLVLFNNFPAGVVLYWTFQSSLALIQQIMTDKMKKEDKEIPTRNSGKNGKR